MKTETWNGHNIRFVEKDGECVVGQGIELREFLSLVEDLTDGKYLDVATTCANHAMTGSMLTPAWTLDDGRTVVKTKWTEIDGIAVKRPFPVFADIEKAYGMTGIDDLSAALWAEEMRDGSLESPPAEGTKGVYVVEATGLGLYKIGMSGNVELRFAQLRTMSPVALSLAGIIETQEPRSLEAELHRLFADKRMHGEWFALDTVELMALNDKFRLGLSISDQIYSRAAGADRQVS